MFSKACLPRLPGGKAKANRNRNLVLNKLARWRGGERQALWDEIPGRRKRTEEPQSAEQKLKKSKENCIAYAQQGMPGKAIDRLMGASLAPDTPEVLAKMKSKFVEPPASQATSQRPPAPEANELSQEAVAKAIASFAKGLAAGPSGTRPDFLKQIVGEKGDKPGLAIVTNLCNVLADGLAPEALRPYMGGANGFALEKTSKEAVAEANEASANRMSTGGTDVRPGCCGEVWRRIVGKSLLATESQNLADHLYPCQLAVAVKAGAECMPHLGRQWFQQCATDPDKVLVDFDESNAHNTVDRHTFLQRAHQVMPGVCRWLEYIYPTDVATYVFYRGRVIESKAGGQQGCPLIGAGHALVQRILLESLGLVDVDPRTSPLAPVLQPKPALDMAPGFADDGFFAGPSQDVLASIRHVSSFMPRLGLSFSRLEAIPAAGEVSTVDMQQFIDAGCTVNPTACVSVMKSPIGTAAYCENEVSKRVDKAAAIVRAISQLPDEHCALYLLRYQVGRMDYTIRTTPAASCAGALKRFDDCVRAAYENIVGFSVSDPQWDQACLPTKHGGKGFRSVSKSADAAYYSSRGATWERCEAIFPDYARLMDDHVRPVESRINAAVPAECQVPPLPCDTGIPSQQRISHSVSAALAAVLQQQAEPFDRARLIAYSAPMVGRWLAAVPSKTIDMHMTGAEVAIASSLHLGVDVMKGGGPCRFCSAVLDSKGVHPASCMSGGDVTLRHNLVQNIVYRYSSRAQLNAELEKAGVLDDYGVFVDLCRPADVMIDSLDASGSGLERVALDIKVINSLGAGHYQDTLDGPLVAAAKYREESCNRASVRTRCAAKGIRYEPLVFTTQGGCETHAEAIISQIAAKVAQAECRDAGKVKAEILQTICMSIMRSVAKAIARRRPRARAQAGAEADALLTELSCLEDPMDY